VWYEPDSVVVKKAERMAAWKEVNPRHAWALHHMAGWYKIECEEAIHGVLMDDERMGNLWMVADQLEDAFAKGDFEGKPLIRCSSCKRAATYATDVIIGVGVPDEEREVVGQVFPVEWRCSVCEGYVCRWCAFQDPDEPARIHDNTYCGEACWRQDGSPDCG
jgi:hypothetical protein